MTNFEKIVQGGVDELGYYMSALMTDAVDGHCAITVSCNGDCKKCFVKRLKQPAKPKLTEDEEIFVRWAKVFGYEWIARNSDGSLHIYTSTPAKIHGDIISGWRHLSDMKVPKQYQFDCVLWIDAAPTRLADLVED